MSIRALCVGHAAYDLCMVVDDYPPENAKARSDLLVESGGGPAANAAWMLAQWGVPTALATLVGQDDYGAQVLSELRRAKVDCRLVRRRAGFPTPVSVIIVNRSNGSRTIINRRLEAAPLALTPRSLRGLNPALLLLDGHQLEASLLALSTFPKAISVLDAGSVREATRVLAERVDFLVCSERFAADITGEADPGGPCWRRTLDGLRKLNQKVVVATLGERGLIYSDGRRQGRVPALKIKAVDTTAAGDLFHGAFAYALVHRLDLIDALKLATLAAGISVGRYGGRPSAPTLEELRQHPAARAWVPPR